MTKTVKLYFCSMLALLVLINTMSSQQSNASEYLKTRQIENIRIESQSIGQLFSEIAIGYNIPIGVEEASEDDGTAKYSISFNKGTLSDLLNQFEENNKRYTWKIVNGVVNIFPKAKFRDSLAEKILGTRIKSFSVKKNTSCIGLAKTLTDTPELFDVLNSFKVKYRGRGVDGFYIPQLGKNFSIEFSESSMLSILNEIIEKSPTAKFWIVKRNSFDKSFNLSLSAMHEDLPMKDGIPQFPKTDF